MKKRNDQLDGALDALERLLRPFVVERYVYLTLTVFAFLLLIYIAYVLFQATDIDTKLLVMIFGSTGLITASSARTTWFFNRAFGLIEELIRRRS
ncbi:MAG: hypothetical protein KDI31_13395, partial [Pseudomonadales bacterium]|nr:hypothetical protein [Pseudomonadales bacterium]